MPVKLEFIFVRHGESCANALKKKYPLSPARFAYRDPELTKRGIERSKNMYQPLRWLIEEKWGSNPTYTIAASALMRTQMTAYYQLASFVQKPINIFPHICEHGLTEDNIPFPQPTQQAVLSKINPQIVQTLENGEDYRAIQTTKTKSDFRLFFLWLTKHLEQFPPSDNQTYRFVIFTHGLFLQSAFSPSIGVPLGKDRLKKGKSIMNNGMFYTEFTLWGTEYPEYEYFDEATFFQGSYTCPDGCRKTLCKKRGGKRAITRKKLKVHRA